MAIILNIDTATEYASVCLSDGNTILAIEENFEQKNHAAFLQPAIKKIQNTLQFQLSSLHAIAVTAGPGSYTGLRVGLASAKGLCYALNKPLLLINTLQVMAYALAKNYQADKTNLLFCPLIDARRMEVFTALYNNHLEPIINPSATIVDENFLKEELKENTIIMGGSGSKKMLQLITHENIIFSTTVHNATDLAAIATQQFENKQFTNLAYSEPYYLKEFYTAKKI